MPTGVYFRTRETRESVSKAMVERHKRAGCLCRICKTNNHTTTEHARRSREALIAFMARLTKEEKIRRSKSFIEAGHAASRGRKKTGKEIERISAGNARRWQDPGYRAKQKVASVHSALRSSEFMRAFWANQENRAKRIYQIVSATVSRPTSYEQQIIDLVERTGFPLRYTGDGRLTIEGLNPDFVVDVAGIRGIVEVYYRYWKERNHGSAAEYQRSRAQKLADSGYSVLFVDGRALSDPRGVAGGISEFIAQLRLHKEFGYDDLAFYAEVSYAS